MATQSRGTKRHRSSDDNSEDEDVEREQFQIRLRPKIEILENYEDDEDSGGPPTPPVPRSTTPSIPRTKVGDEGEDGVLATNNVTVVKREVLMETDDVSNDESEDLLVDPRQRRDPVPIREEPEPSEPIPSTSKQGLLRSPRESPGSHVGDGGGEPVRKRVKNEPRERENDEAEERNNMVNGEGTVTAGRNRAVVNENEEETVKGKDKGEGESSSDPPPPITNFFTFTTTDPGKPTVPNAVAAEVKNFDNLVRPQAAPYHTRAPEEELRYANAGNITIPMFEEGDKNHESGAESDEAEDERRESFHETGAKLTRYFQKNHVYKKYDFERNNKIDVTKVAVIHEKKAHILSTLEKNRVLIIEGFTGCGKTTQVPQFILDQCREKGRFCNIVVTQPRKIAAISVARRVCFERNWQLGSVVGYQVGMEAKKDKDDTLLTFMTTGVLLQKLISQRSLKEYTHIIIDEVHERDLESDFLLLVIKSIMAADVAGKERHVKLILMSATIDTEKFENYFQLQSSDGQPRKPPVIKIPFRACHRVDEYFLDDLLADKMDFLNIIESNMDKEKATIHEDIYRIAASCIIAMDDLERESVLDPRMRGRSGVQKERGAVLVFLPGMEEIKTLQRVLETERKNRSSQCQYDLKWVVIPLHSSVTAEDQAKVFDTAGQTFRKIILSTNIAESSVTVPDIAYVIDFCLTKSLCIDHHTNFTTLRMVWASKSQCIQRKGRAGRVAEGKVYRLVPRRFYGTLEKDIIPEMRRSNLETIILMCKKFDLDTPVNLLRDAMDPPDMSHLERAVSTLKELGALTIVKQTRNHQIIYDTCDGDLTFVGQVMAALPIPQQCTRLILFGHCFGVMKEAIIIAAGLSVKSPFQTGFQKQLDTYLEKMKHAKRSFSDLFALYHVYKFWICNYCESGTGTSGARRHNEFRWAKGAMVHLSVLREIKSTVELLEERLKKLGIEDRESYSLPAEQTTSNPLELTAQQGIFLKLSIAAAFYPNYFLRRRPDLRQYERDMNKEVNGNDVFRTVYFKGFPPEHNGKLYAKHVADYLACGLSIPSIRFDGQKVFAIFDNSIGDTIGPFSTGMFRAIKLRQLRNESLEFRVLWKEDERRALSQWEDVVRRRRCIQCPPLYYLPPLDTHVLKVKIQHILSPSQFWVLVGQAFHTFEEIYNIITDNFQHIPLHPSKLCPNCLCLAPFEGCYYRAKVLRTEDLGERKSLVYFVDYGNSVWVNTAALSDFSPYMRDKGITGKPCLAMECRLAEMKPNTVHGLHWSEESIETMKRFCAKAPNLEFKIFSVYQSVMVGELIGYKDVSRTQDCSLNKLLISQNEAGKIYAEKAAEPYLSMENHRKRSRSHLMETGEKNAARDEQAGDPLDLDFIQPPREGLKQPVTLKGPWSPLEMNFQALVHCSTTKPVKVDNNSVNSVLLDHEPTTSTSRMLVASHIGVADKSKSVMIRDSTVMSAIPGILQLVCLMFAPKVELRVDNNLTKYVGLICGCGTVPVTHNNPNIDPNTAVHPDNDMEIVFDTEIDNDDIQKVNLVRFYLNSILKNFRSANKAEHHKLLRDYVIQILKKQRKKLDEEVWPQEEYVWNRIPADCIDETFRQGIQYSHEDIFPPHVTVKLNSVASTPLVWDGGY